MLSDIAILSLAVITMLGSPGPATLALAGVGAAFGPQRGAPFLIGILTGVVAVMTLTAFGVSTLLSVSPLLRSGVQALALCYIMYLAWRIAGSGAYQAADGVSPPSYVDGFVLNIVNVKAYAAFAAIFAAFSVEHPVPYVSAGVTAIIVFILIVVIDIAWLFAGRALSALVGDPVRGRQLRWSFAAIMVAAAFYGVIRI